MRIEHGFLSASRKDASTQNPQTSHACEGSLPRRSTHAISHQGIPTVGPSIKYTAVKEVFGMEVSARASHLTSDNLVANTRTHTC